MQSKLAKLNNIIDRPDFSYLCKATKDVEKTLRYLYSTQAALSVIDAYLKHLDIFYSWLNTDTQSKQTLFDILTHAKALATHTNKQDTKNHCKDMATTFIFGLNQLHGELIKFLDAFVKPISQTQRGKYLLMYPSKRLKEDKEKTARVIKQAANGEFTIRVVMECLSPFGCSYRQSGAHYVVECPGKGSVTMAKTPSDSRACKNAAAQLVRSFLK